MTTIPFARFSPASSRRCWLCGTTEGPLRADVHVNGHLCPHCWAVRPRGRNTWVRSASALASRLELGHHWTDSGLRQGWLQNVAHRRHITAWRDAPTGTPGPDEPFGWIAPDVFDQAAADLEQQEAEYNRSRITR